MFARTERLLLRPGFAEDAPALAAAIGDEAIVRNLSSVPWPYGAAQAEAFLAEKRDPVLPFFVMLERTGGAPRLVGACELSRRASGAVELGYWVARKDWGRGFATEAGRQLIEIARTLKLARLEAAHFLDNPQSGRVLEKLGFQATGLTVPRTRCTRDTESTVALYRMELIKRSVCLAA